MTEVILLPVLHSQAFEFDFFFFSRILGPTFSPDVVSLTGVLSKLLAQGKFTREDDHPSPMWHQQHLLLLCLTLSLKYASL